MRLLLDQALYLATIKWLIKNGHDVVTAKDLDLQRAPDGELLGKSAKLDRLLVTRDKDFGALVFLHDKPTHGVIRLAITPTTVESVHQELRQLLEKHEASELKKSFCVVEPDRHRIRKVD